MAATVASQVNRKVPVVHTTPPTAATTVATRPATSSACGATRRVREAAAGSGVVADLIEAVVAAPDGDDLPDDQQHGRAQPQPAGREERPLGRETEAVEQRPEGEGDDGAVEERVEESAEHWSAWSSSWSGRGGAMERP